MYREKIRNKIEEIYLEISSNFENIKDDGLMGGKAGAILFIYYYWLYKGKNRNIPIYYFVDDLIKLIKKDTNNFTFANGIAGMGWLLSFFGNRSLIDISNEYFDEIDELIYRNSVKEIKRKNYDLLYGGDRKSVV